MATTKARHVYTDVSFGPDDFIMFGKESAGIPEEILVDNEDTCIRIPMLDKIRSLNLSNSVAVVLYEALRQNNFEGMLLEGELHSRRVNNSNGGIRYHGAGGSIYIGVSDLSGPNFSINTNCPSAPFVLH